jgi:hypothetical protein
MSQGVWHGRCYSKPTENHAQGVRTSGNRQIPAGHTQASRYPVRPAGHENVILLICQLLEQRLHKQWFSADIGKHGKLITPAQRFIAFSMWMFNLLPV